jgi:hypothetical protein
LILIKRGIHTYHDEAGIGIYLAAAALMSNSQTQTTSVVLLSISIPGAV